MGKQLVMALDVGGGSGRCLVLNVGDGSLFTAKREWSHTTAPGTGGLGYDLDLNDIWKKLGDASREALERSGARPSEVTCIAATSMRNTTVVLGSEGDVLLATPNQDARALGESFEWAAREGKDVYEKGGHWPSPLFTGSRLLWMRANAPERLDKASVVLSLSDWVGLQLGARPHAERSQAGETLLFDLEKRDWDDGLITSNGFYRGLFPDCVDAGTVVGALSKAAASQMGLIEGIPIAAAGADTQCGLLGAGAVSAGDLGVIAGTTMPVQLVTDRPMLDGEGKLWSGLHVIPGLYVLESNGLATGQVVEWFAEIVYAEYEDPVMVLFCEAEASEPGGAGVYSTLGACTFDGRKINVPMGNISISHMVTPGSREGRGHVSRSVIEGIAYSARANIEQISAVVGHDFDEIRVTGGMSRSPLWTRVLCDVTGTAVLVPYTCEASALGAALCAAVGAGAFPSLVEGAEALVKITREHQPTEHAQKYQALYAGWSESCTLRAATDEHVTTLMTMAMLERSTTTAGTDTPSFRPRILVTASMDAAALEELSALGEVVYDGWREANRVYTGGQELVAALRGFQVFVTEMDIVDFEALRDSPELRAVVSCRVNPVNVDVEAATAYGIPVMNTPGRNADAVADLTLAFMVMLARRMPSSALFLRNSEGEAGDLARMGEAYQRYQGSELWRKTVGIVGMGEVGKGVARRARSFGARVLFCDPNRSEVEGALFNARKVSFDELLSLSDFVSIHAPANESTRKMMDHDAFSKMREGAFFINTARASLVDEDALAEALESDRLAGAALDVFSVEPPAQDDRLVARDDVITTPHIGGNTFEIAAHQGAIAAGQLRRLLRGETPEHILNPEVIERFARAGPRPEPDRAEIERLAKKPKPSITS